MPETDEEETGKNPYSWWERHLCGLSSRDLDKSVRNVAILELSFQVLSLVQLVFTVIDEGGIHKRADKWGFVDLVLQMPTVGVLLWYTMRMQPQPFFLRYFYVWLWVVALLYLVGILWDVWDLLGSPAKAGRYVALVLDLLSLALFANLLYLVHLLKKRYNVESEAPAEATLLTGNSRDR